MSDAALFSRFGAMTLMLLTCSAWPLQAAVLHVPRDYPTIQDAVDHAAQAGDSILVAAGTYVESVSIYEKTVALTSESGAQSTIIDGNGTDTAIAFVARYGIAHKDVFSLSGFTIRNAQHAGVIIAGGRGVIERNVVTGTGVSGNEIFYAISFENSGGIVRDNEISNNYGDAVDLFNPDHVIIDNNRIQQNDLGGISVRGGRVQNGHVIISGNLIAANRFIAVSADGDEVPIDLEMHDNLVVRNQQGMGMGLALSGRVNGNIVNNTFAQAGGGSPLTSFVLDDGSRLQFANNILFVAGSEPAMQCYGGAAPDLHHDDILSTNGIGVQGSNCVTAFAAGLGNVSTDPRFTTGEGRNPWRLRADSPLIDAGSNAAVHGFHLDLSGHPRIVGSAVDLGAYEFQTP